MSFKHLRAFIAIMAGCMLASCHSEIDLKNIDKTAELEMGLALPIGSVHATMGDFLGANQVEQIKVDEYGIFHFMTTVDIPSKTYHHINIADYIIKNESTVKFPIAEKTGGPTIIPGGTGEIELPFDLELGMEGINEDATQERIDSIWITEADFTSIINVENFDLHWSEITGVQLKLGDQFRRDEKLIDIPISGHNFDQEIPIKINNFTLSLMKDPSNPDAGTVNKIKFQIIFKVNPTHNITVTTDSKFAYDMRVNLIDYDAIWGWFQAGNQMRDCQRLSMDSLWDGWKDVRKLKVRFAEPSILVTFSYKIAAPLRMYIDSLVAIDSLGHATSATWDGQPRTDFDLRPTLSPYTKDLKDSVITTRLFNYESSKGHIDKMFDVRPDTFSYGFHLLVDHIISHFDIIVSHLVIAVNGKRKLWSHGNVEDELKRAFFLKVLRHLFLRRHRLTQHGDIVLPHIFVQFLSEQFVDLIYFDGRTVLALNEAHRHVAGSESGHLCLAAILLQFVIYQFLVVLFLHDNGHQSIDFVGIFE